MTSPYVIYRTIYNMCTQKPPHDYSEQLYNKYRDAFTKYITNSVSTNSHSDRSMQNSAGFRMGSKHIRPPVGDQT